MVTDLNRILYVLNALNTIWRGYNNQRQAFNLKEIDSEKYGNINVVWDKLTEDDSEYKISMVELQPLHYFGYAVIDKNDEVVAVYQFGNHVKGNCIYQDWAILDGTKPNEFYVYDGRNTEHHVEISTELGEDEHFQMMMERNMPDYDTMLEVFEYIKKVKPVLDKYKMVSPISYEQLKLDFSGIKFRSDILDMMDDESLDIDVIHNMHDESALPFSTEWNEKYPIKAW